MRADAYPQTASAAAIDRHGGPCPAKAVWREKEVWTGLEQHGIAYNELHDKFYPSIGCIPCTCAITPGKDVRAGRWWWEAPESKECGLHVKA
ncbi:MAG: hypothetical protein FIB06_04880 [Betaproteobacteria bacterium]|nr:hypothetical protein [Betaproteobacteria bacterium]